jgi:hypothetical protein
MVRRGPPESPTPDRGGEGARAGAGPARPDTEISPAGAAVRTLVIRSREAIEIATGVSRALGAGPRREVDLGVR